MIVDLTDKLVPQVRAMHHEDFPFPNLESKLYFGRRAVIEHQRIIAAGFLKITSEALVITNQAANRLQRARAIDELMKVMVFDLAKNGLDGAHVFLQGDVKGTQKFLSRYGFVEVHEPAMYLPLGESNGKET